jgi:hypothetical protein
MGSPVDTFHDTADAWIFHHPATHSIFGPSFSGKSTYLKNLLMHRDKLIQPNAERIVFIYSEEQPHYFQELKRITPQIEFIKGLQTAESSLELDPNVRSLLIFEDLFLEALSSKYFMDLTTKIAHHSNASVIYTSQNMYQQSRWAKSISNQSKYIVLFKNVRDVNQIKYLGQQVLGSNGGGQMLNRVLNDVTKDNKFGYLILDLHPFGDDRFRIITKIFPHESPYPIAYQINS